MSGSSQNSPYADQPSHAFWRTAVVEQRPETIAKLHQPRFDLTPQTAIMTAGSCFAQHLHRELSGLGWHIILKEDVSGRLPDKVAARYGYGQYSARYGNIYTARQWLELIREALSATPPHPIIWTKEDRFYDALRPSAEPTGLACKDDVAQARSAHLLAVREALHEAHCVIFTLGLTEAWVDRATERTLPTAPGTLAGNMIDTPADFVNFCYEDVLSDLTEARALLRSINPEMRILLTVSPVPLTATATSSHVVLASAASKAILRAACDGMLRRFDDVDYFPSYEIITSPVLGGPFFATNCRTPSRDGVAKVMQVFADSYTGGQTAKVNPTSTGSPEDEALEVACEEMLLEAFAK